VLFSLEIDRRKKKFQKVKEFFRVLNPDSPSLKKNGGGKSFFFSIQNRAVIFSAQYLTILPSSVLVSLYSTSEKETFRQQAFSRPERERDFFLFHRYTQFGSLKHLVLGPF